MPALFFFPFLTCRLRNIGFFFCFLLRGRVSVAVRHACLPFQPPISADTFSPSLRFQTLLRTFARAARGVKNFIFFPPLPDLVFTCLLRPPEIDLKMFYYTRVDGWGRRFFELTPRSPLAPDDPVFAQSQLRECRGTESKCVRPASHR